MRPFMLLSRCTNSSTWRRSAAVPSTWRRLPATGRFAGCGERIWIPRSSDEDFAMTMLEQSKDFVEKLKSLPPADWVQEMLEHYHRTGGFRPRDRDGCWAARSGTTRSGTPFSTLSAPKVCNQMGRGRRRPARRRPRPIVHIGRRQSRLGRTFAFPPRGGHLRSSAFIPLHISPPPRLPKRPLRMVRSASPRNVEVHHGEPSLHQRPVLVLALPSSSPIGADFRAHKLLWRIGARSG